MSLTLRKKIIAAFGLALLLIVLIAITSRDAIVSAIDANAWADHTNAVLADLQDLQLRLDNIQTGVLTFALTGDTIYLQAYRHGRAPIHANITALRSITRDNLAQQRRIARLSPLVSRKLDQMDQIVRARRAAGTFGATPRVRSSDTQPAHDDVARIIGSMRHEESSLLHERENRANAAAHRALTIIVFGLPIAFVILVLLAYSISSSLIGPLHRLTHIARRISAGDLSTAPHPSGRGDEIGTLKTAFAVMISGLREHSRARNTAEQELRQVNLDLESEVTRRTRDLSYSNAKLQAEIEARRQAERALNEEHERLQTTLASIGDGVIAADRDGRVALLNKAGESMTGWSEAEAKGHPFSDVFHIIHEETREVRENPVGVVLASGQTIELGNHTVLIAKNGLERVIADSAAPIRDSDGDIMGAVLVFRDMTDKVRLEQEVVRRQKLDSLGTLAGGIAHDFNNLLTAILGNISLARVAPQDIKSLLTEAEGACLRARDLTQQLLTFAKGGAPIKRLAYLKNLIQESAGFALRGSNVSCRCELDEDLWPVHIDTGQINQALHNVIINAKEAMPDGGVAFIRAQNISLAEGVNPFLAGDHVCITVADEGSGMSADVISRVFEPYFSTKRRGSGLGLASAYSIVRQHDGYIDIESALGVGTRVSIFLPAVPSPGNNMEQNDRETGATLLPGAGRILMMDDDETIRRFSSSVLTMCGYEVSLAENGETAIELFRSALRDGSPYDVAILDLTVPGGMGGLASLEQLRQIDSRFEAIASSGYATDPIMSNPEQYGFDAVLAKPYQVEALSEMVAAAIARRRATRAPRES